MPKTKDLGKMSLVELARHYAAARPKNCTTFTEWAWAGSAILEDERLTWQRRLDSALAFGSSYDLVRYVVAPSIPKIPDHDFDLLRHTLAYCAGVAGKFFSEFEAGEDDQHMIEHLANGLRAMDKRPGYEQQTENLANHFCRLYFEDGENDPALICKILGMTSKNRFRRAKSKVRTAAHPHPAG